MGERKRETDTGTSTRRLRPRRQTFPSLASYVPRSDTHDEGSHRDDRADRIEQGRQDCDRERDSNRNRDWYNDGGNARRKK